MVVFLQILCVACLIGSRHHHDAVAARRVHVDHRGSGRQRFGFPQAGHVHAAGRQALPLSGSELIPADAAQHLHLSAQPSDGVRLIGSLAAQVVCKLLSHNRFAHRRHSFHGYGQIHIQAANHQYMFSHLILLAGILLMKMFS